MRDSIDENHANVLPFISECISLTENGCDFAQAWEKAIENDRYIYSLLSQDARLLITFGSRLGTTDVSGQVSLCVLYQKLFEEKLKAAVNYEERYGKIYRQGGVFIGAAVMILIL